MIKNTPFILICKFGNSLHSCLPDSDLSEPWSSSDMCWIILFLGRDPSPLACLSATNGMLWFPSGKQRPMSDSLEVLASRSDWAGSWFCERGGAGSACLVGDSWSWLTSSLALVDPLLLVELSQVTLSLLLLLQLNEAGSFLNWSTSFLKAASCIYIVSYSVLALSVELGR